MRLKDRIALVFGAGTTRWSLGLDATHDAGDIAGSPPATDLNIQQATVNLLSDMAYCHRRPPAISCPAQAPMTRCRR